MKSFGFLFLTLLASVCGAEPALKVAVYEQEFACVRVNQLPEDLAQEWAALRPTNRVTGVVWDLRFTTAAAGAKLPALPVLAKTPPVLLVNQQTSPAVWRWAAEWRAKNGAILIGGTNAQAALTPDITVATRLEEDRKFQQNPFAEPAVSSAQTLAGTNTLLALVDHTSEAELVRQRVKDGEEDSTSVARAEAPKVVRDPALARALDLLKAWAVLKPVRG